MSSARVIGIDVGTSSAKGVAIDERGVVLAEAEHPIPISRPHPGWSEQDPDDWLRAFIRGTREVLEAARATPLEIAAVGID
ncbi:MAG: FGGY family carbohydrate kinase, partial [Solirubrobacteraceae bacterium]